MNKNDKYIISVSEPWDFKSPDGENIIKGKIIDKKSNQCLVFKTDYYLKCNNTESNILVLTPRHYIVDFLDFNNKLCLVNGGLLVKKYNEFMTEMELKENSKFTIIGSIKKDKQ